MVARQACHDVNWGEKGVFKHTNPSSKPNPVLLPFKLQTASIKEKPAVAITRRRSDEIPAYTV